MVSRHFSFPHEWKNTKVIFQMTRCIQINVHIPLPEAMLPGDHVDTEKDYMHNQLMAAFYKISAVIYNYVCIYVCITTMHTTPPIQEENKH